MTNQDRSDRARTAIEAYAPTIGPGWREELRYDLPAVVSDLLTDLRHFCDENDIHFPTMIERSEAHWFIEREKPHLASSLPGRAT